MENNLKCKICGSPYVTVRDDMIVCEACGSSYPAEEQNTAPDLPQTATFASEQQNFGTQQPDGYGTQQQGFGSQQPDGFGTQQQGYGAQQPGGFGTQQPGGFGTQQQGFGTQQPGGFGTQQQGLGGAQQPYGYDPANPYGTQQPQQKKKVPTFVWVIIIIAAIILIYAISNGGSNSNNSNTNNGGTNNGGSVASKSEDSIITGSWYLTQLNDTVVYDKSTMTFTIRDNHTAHLHATPDLDFDDIDFTWSYTELTDINGKPVYEYSFIDGDGDEWTGYSYKSSPGLFYLGISFGEDSTYVFEFTKN